MIVVLIILLILCLGGVGFGYRGNAYGYPAGGIIGLILIVLVILFLMGRI